MVAFFKRWGISFLIVAVAALVVLGVGAWLTSGNRPATGSGTVFTVARGDIRALVRTTGRIELARQTRLSFRTNDIVRRVNIKAGDYVPAGTLMMELDSTLLERELSAAQAQREIARFNLSAQAERGQNPGTVSELYSLARQSEQADAQLARAKAALDNARIYAPYDGTVLSVEVNEGDSVGGGQPAMTFGDMTRFQIRADVDEIDVANVAVGQTVQFTLDAFPGRTFDGNVTLLSPAPSQRQGSTAYAATVSFVQQPELTIRPGMAANLTITSLSRKGVLLVPNRALETIGLRKYVTRQSAAGLEKIPVETGLNNPDQTEIISGLREGDKILLPR